MQYWHLTDFELKPNLNSMLKIQTTFLTTFEQFFDNLSCKTCNIGTLQISN